MNKLNIVFIIVASIIVLSLIIKLVFTHAFEKIKNIKDKLNTSENECLDLFIKKYEVLTNLIELTENKYKIESKTFDNAKKLKTDSLDSIKNEKILNKAYNEVIQIKEDHSKVRQTKNFKELVGKYNENEINLISVRTFHNKYTLIYNSLIKKFPYNIVSKIKKMNINELIEGKELDINFNNDLEV